MADFAAALASLRDWPALRNCAGTGRDASRCPWLPSRWKPGTGDERVQRRLQSVLVALETALAMLLLVASGLLLRSFAKMLATDPGFQTQHFLTASLSLPRHDYPTQQKVDAFYDELQRKIEALPGVKTVGFSSNIPIVGQRVRTADCPEGYVRPPGGAGSSPRIILCKGNIFKRSSFR